jgi:hypothetical protein
MTDESEKKLLQRIKDKVADTVAEQIGLGLFGLLCLFAVTPAREWMANEWACIRKPWCEVQGWSLGGLIAFTLVAAVAAIHFGVKWYRTQRAAAQAAQAAQVVQTTLTERVAQAEQTALAAQAERAALATQVAQAKRAVKTQVLAQPFFREIKVEDRALGLHWILRRPPNDWRDLRNIAITVTPSYLRQILDGPFHSAPGCNAQLEEHWHTESFSEQCPTCNQQIFRARASESGFGSAVNARHVRAQALEELQRMERNGTVFDGTTIVLDNPGYWKTMRPVRALPVK